MNILNDALIVCAVIIGAAISIWLLAALIYLGWLIKSGMLFSHRLGPDE